MKKQDISPEVIAILKAMDDGNVLAARRALEYVPPSKDDRQIFKTCDFHLAPER